MSNKANAAQWIVFRIHISILNSTDDSEANNDGQCVRTSVRAWPGDPVAIVDLLHRVMHVVATGCYYIVRETSLHLPLMAPSAFLILPFV